jgi:Protein of unknown function (DUF4236)
MGLRFRQRIKVFPGVQLNVSLGGMSVSLGAPGATVNIGKNMRVRATVGLPGTGISYQGTLYPGTAHTERTNRIVALPEAAPQAQGGIDDHMACSTPTEQAPRPLTGAPWTPAELIGVQTLIIEAHQERQALDAELVQLQQSVASAQAHLAQVDTLWRRWFSKRRIQSAQSALHEAQTAYAHVRELGHQQGIPISWLVDEDLQQRFAKFSKDMRSMLHHAQGWHLLKMTGKVGDNRAWHSSPMMHRTRCTVGFGNPAFFVPSDNPLYQNAPFITCADGVLLYFYPTFILVQREDAFGLLPPEDLDIAIDTLRVAEHDSAYATAHAEQYTWRYVNKNGTPDQRYTSNPQVPLLEYDHLTPCSPQGLIETFLFMDNTYAFASWMGVRDWYEAAHKYQALQALPMTEVQWIVREDSDASYFVAQHDGKELLGLGLTRQTQQFWVCLNTEPLGVGVNSGCTFHFWLDGQQLELGNLPGLTQHIGADNAAFRVSPSRESHDQGYMQQCLSSALDAVVLVECNAAPVVRLRLALADPAPFWRAVQSSVVEE